MASERDVRPPATRSIAVFGSSEPAPGDALYDNARRLGQQLARAGFRVVTGGYGGVMEGASRGAREEGGATLGVTCAIFADRRPNPYLTEEIHAADLHERTRVLIDRAQGYAVLSGKAGTLAELAWLWALDRAGCLNGRPVVLLGDRWSSLIELLKGEGMLGPSQIHRTRLVRTPDDAVRLFDEALPREGGPGA